MATLEGEAWERAKGIITTAKDGSERSTHSDVLLMFLLKGRWPSKYRDNYTPPDTVGEPDLMGLERDASP